MQPINVHAASLVEEREVLPANVRPYHYTLSIEPDFEQFTFKGHVDINLLVVEETQEIVLNANELEIDRVQVKGLPPQDLKFTLNPQKERLAISLPSKLPVGDYLLRIDYRGHVNDKMAGFYRSTYTEKASGLPRVMGVTQFEATDARKAFPCWDEPAVKATFDIELVVPQGMTALSNMDEISQDEEIGEAGKKLTRFKFRKTPVMSTYLVAWVIGHLDYVEQVNKEGIEVRVYAPRGEADQGKFALDVASRTLSFFTDYFGIPYPLPKMDLVAVPDFAAGAMENWGLVTYRTVYVLFDEHHSSLRTKQNVTYVVGHELAHQWFGNLVTMAWWSDLWLNEGFATWVGWLAADRLFPEWDIWTEFVLDDVQRGLSLDGLRSSHPIQVPVPDPAAISQIFDAISYSKGASLIRQLVSYVGEEKFRAGLQAYLKQHQWSNARTEDLWAALSASTGLDIQALMDNWTKQMGYPVVQVSQLSGSHAAGKCRCRQERFLSTGDATGEEDGTVWGIPLNASSSKQAWKVSSQGRQLLATKEADLALQLHGQGKFHAHLFCVDVFSSNF